MSFWNNSPQGNSCSYCCNSNSLGSTEMGFYDFPGGNPLKFKSGSPQFLPSVWSRRHFASHQQLRWGATHEPLLLWTTQEGNEKESMRESSPRAWMPFLCVYPPYSEAAVSFRHDFPSGVSGRPEVRSQPFAPKILLSFNLQRKKAKILFAEQTPEENKNGACWQGAWPDRSLFCLRKRQQQLSQGEEQRGKGTPVAGQPQTSKPNPSIWGSATSGPRFPVQFWVDRQAWLSSRMSTRLFSPLLLSPLEAQQISHLIGYNNHIRYHLCFIYIILLNPYNKPMKWTLLYSFYIWIT